MAGILYIVPTPIGNLDDITLRCLRVLNQVDVIAAEDTRHTGLLLQHYKIKKQMLSYQEHNELQRIPQLIKMLEEDQNVALVSDAGTPGLSDPGYRLIRQAIASQIVVEVLPGPSAILVGLVGSGLATDAFYFGGFLARTSSKRQKQLLELSEIQASLVFFESPYRTAAALADALTVLGDRQVVVARELTKVHQEYWRGSLSEASSHFSQKATRGEIVLIIDRQRD